MGFCENLISGQGRRGLNSLRGKGAVSLVGDGIFLYNTVVVKEYK